MREAPLDYALRYAGAGYRIIPVQPRGKAPLTSHGAHDATTDEATIQQWWRRWPDANIGMTLRDLVVVDVDPRNHGDVDALPEKLPDTCFARTGGGGWHYLYKASGARYAPNPAPGIDVKAGAGQYIVVEPSVHKSGDSYNWLDETDPWAYQPAPAPAWLMQPDQRKQPNANPPKGKIPSGRRNETLTSMAGSMRRRGMLAESIEAALRAENAARCEPALPDNDVRRIAASVGRYAPSADAAGQKIRQDAEHLLEHAFWVADARVTTALPYVVKGIFGRGQIIVFWGAPGSGKTFLCMELACCVGAQTNWRGRRTRHGVVVYVAAESSRVYVENRIAALKQECPELAKADVLIVPLALDLLHAARGDIDRVIETCSILLADRGDVAMIVIDTLAVTFGGGNENAPEDMGAYVANIQEIRNRTGAAVLIVHHCGKDEAKGMRGHSALLGALDAELTIDGIGNQERILRTGKVRDGDGYTDLFAFTLRTVELGTDADGDAVKSCVVESKDEAGTARVRRERKGAGLGKHQRTVLRVLEGFGGRMPRTELAYKLKDEGLTRQRVHDSIASLLDSGMLIANNNAAPPEISIA